MTRLMIPSDFEIAQLINVIYDGSGVATGHWDYFDSGTDALGICWGLKTVEDFDIVVFRGSATPLDWARDLDAITDPLQHDILGPVHPGFFEGLPQTWQRIKPLLKNPVIFAGHSLGAARADLISGLAIIDGIVPARTVVIGEPRPAFSQLSEILTPYPRASYRNISIFGEFDPVTGLPLAFPPEEYVHPTPLIDLFVIPDLFDPWGPLALHHSEVYLRGLGKLN